MTYSLIFPSNRHRRSKVGLLLAVWAIVTMVTLFPCNDEIAAATLSPANVGVSTPQQDSDCSCPSSEATHAVGKAICMDTDSAQDSAQLLPLSLPLALAMLLLPTANPTTYPEYALNEQMGRNSQRLYLTTSLRLRD